jgi:hypothetical protein
MKKPRRRIYGWRWKRLPTGERTACAPRLVRWLQHHAWLAAFRLVPMRWMRAGRLRRWMWGEIVARFGWWGYSQ